MARTQRMRAPLLGAFRSAFVARDARTPLDMRDDNGDRVVAGRRTASRGGMSEAELQRSVAQDVEMLMNTVHLASTLDLSEYGSVASSVLNYGLPDLVHRSIDEGSLRDIADEIETALTTYETRLAPRSVLVRRDPEVDPTSLKIRFFVKAELDCDPLNIPVEFVADLERESGKITIRRT